MKLLDALGTVGATLLVVAGFLWFFTGHYDRAAACFSAALLVRIEQKTSR